MDSIEQAREALTEARKVVDAVAGDNRPAISWGIRVRDEIDAALAALSSTTPVDGVGAEPVAWADCFIALQHWRDADHEDVLTLSRNDIIALIEAYRSALADPEAEARLRERVAECPIEFPCARLTRMAQAHTEASKRAEAAEARLAQAEGGPAVTEAWQPIESAPLDGTTVDLWHEDLGRHTDHYWGVPSHECGEAGSFCDSDWHSISEGWVDGTFNSLSDEPQGFTHWMPHPKPPAALHPKSAAGEGEAK